MVSKIEGRYIPIITKGLTDDELAGKVLDSNSYEYVSEEMPITDVRELAKKMNEDMENPQVGHVWTYTQKNTQYIILHRGIMKIQDGAWENSVIYKPLDSDMIFTRDTETFKEKFEYYSHKNI